jgi:ring-1,2-phenylacetyl-CoA epoxidase subunit PaaC
VHQIQTAQEASQNSEYKKALAELLYQLADDDFLLAFRGSEWLGLAPHIEEDIAYSSINQDTMGHAVMYYQLLEELGEGSANSLAHGRSASERKNAIFAELANGSGTYLEEPRYDWAFAVVRHYFYDIHKKLKLESLQKSSYLPLRNAAAKMKMELYYHLMHWRVWFNQLSLSGGEGKTRMYAAIQKAWEDLGGLLSHGPYERSMADYGLIEEPSSFLNRWEKEMQLIFADVGIPYPRSPQMKKGDGRDGTHSNDLNQALATLNEVYVLDPQASW